jgi:hypothetical protein
LRINKIRLRTAAGFDFAILCDFAALREMPSAKGVGSRQGAKPQKTRKANHYRLSAI